MYKYLKLIESGKQALDKIMEEVKEYV